MSYFNESITELQQLAEAGKHDAELSLAQALMNRGFTLLSQGDIDLAIRDEERALAIFRRRVHDDRGVKGLTAHALLDPPRLVFARVEERRASNCNIRGRLFSKSSWRLGSPVRLSSCGRLLEPQCSGRKPISKLPAVF